jgi:hypothetical protein
MMSYLDGLANSASGSNANGHGDGFPDCLPVLRIGSYNVAYVLVSLRCQCPHYPQFPGPCREGDYGVLRNLLFLAEEASNGQEVGVKE